MRRIPYLYVIGMLLTACGTHDHATADVFQGVQFVDLQASSYAEPSLSVGDYQIGDKRYCYTRSGLVLRDMPAQSGARLGVVPMFDSVVVIDPAPFTRAFQTREACGLTIPGHWVQVRHKGKTGWVFDGYLLPLPPRGVLLGEHFWGKQGKLVASTEEPPEDLKFLWSFEAEEWENGVRDTYMRGEAGGQIINVIPQTLLTFEETYLFAIAEDPKENYPKRWKCTCADSPKKVSCESEDQFRFLEVRSDAHGDHVIDYSWAD